MTGKRRRRRNMGGISFQTRLRLLLSLLGIFVLGIVAFGLYRQSQPELVTDEAGHLAVAAEVGALAPDFELPTLGGKIQKLSDYRGQPVVLTFMHTW